MRLQLLLWDPMLLPRYFIESVARQFSIADGLGRSFVRRLVRPSRVGREGQ